MSMLAGRKRWWCEVRGGEASAEAEKRAEVV